MSTILTARYHTGRRVKGIRPRREYFHKTLDKPTKPVTSHHSGDSVNNQTRVDNATKRNQYHQAAAQVR